MGIIKIIMTFLCETSLVLFPDLRKCFSLFPCTTIYGNVVKCSFENKDETITFSPNMILQHLEA